MKQLLKPGLFIYECIRTILLVFTLIFLLKSMGSINAALWMVFAAPAALFPLMSLFLWINIDRYKNYLPLYIAGKIIGIIVFLGWSIIYGKFTMIQWMSGDLLALGAALILKKEIREDTQCE